MTKFYGMDGQEITMRQFAELCEDPSGRIVNSTFLPGGVHVSTVLLGMDMSFGSTVSPLIFESMVFGPDDAMDLDTERYSTREAAEQGHQALVTKWTGWTPGEEAPEDDSVQSRLAEHRKRYAGSSYVLSDDDYPREGDVIGSREPDGSMAISEYREG